MENRLSPAVARIGYWSAVLATVFSLIYVLAQFAEWFGWLGSAGGPESSSTSLGLVILLTPSLLLGSAFLVLMVAIHYFASADRRIWSHIAIVFATIYCALISINYFVQLTLVVPHMVRGETESIDFLLFKPFDSFLYSVDILGYSFMSLSTLFAAFAFTGSGLERITRRFLLANGFLIPFLALQNYYHPLIWGGSLWAITFPGATISLALLFKRSR